MAVQLVNGVNGSGINALGTVASPGYQRAYAATTVQIVRQGVLRPAAFAQWEALIPGTETAYGGPLYGSAYGETPMAFPQRTDERGLIQVWAAEPVRVELRVAVSGYPSVKQILDLQFTEDPGDPALDALAAHEADANDPHDAAGYITLAEAEENFLTAESADELFLTQEEGDQRYAMAALSGISQDAADLRYVNLSGDTMTGMLKVAWPGGTTQVTLEHPDPNTPVTLAYTRGDKWRWQVGIIQGAETGSNAGSDFLIGRYDDAGNWIDQVLTLYRNTGDARFGGNVGVVGYLQWGLSTTGFRVAPEGNYLVTRRNADLAILETLDINGNYGTAGQVTVGNGNIYGGNGTGLYLRSPGSNIVFSPSMGYVHPEANNATNLGHPSIRWANVYTARLDASADIFAAADILAGAKITSNGGTVQAGNSAGLYTQLRYDGLYGIIPQRMVIRCDFGLSFQPAAGAQILVIENSPDGFYPGTATMVVNCGNSTHRWASVYCQNVNQNCTEAVKEHIVYQDPDEVLRDVLATPVARFRYKATSEAGPSEEQFGIIAERTPRRLLATEDSASPMAVAAAGLAGVQALQAQIDALRAEVALLRGAA